MVFVGFLLLAAAIAVGAGVVLDDGGPAHLVVFGRTVPGVEEQWQVFLAGAAVAVVFVAGMSLTFMGAARRVRARRDLRYLREEHEESLTTLEMEKRRLERELARVRGSGASGPTAPDPSGAPGPSGPPVPPAPRRTPPARPAAPAVRVAPRSQIPATSPFFDRTE
ncbi:hypothetical protein [Actinomadura fibrosa]|uniref:LapA family protein n=1 Tax=Actinomadura fibrosa TaxID=111802 RepID=A0ABW2XH29_9ACTN|nr:hypothetical protein [Actinomadura fibrosa]